MVDRRSAPSRALEASGAGADGGARDIRRAGQIRADQPASRTRDSATASFSASAAKSARF